MTPKDKQTFGGSIDDPLVLEPYSKVTVPGPRRPGSPPCGLAASQRAFGCLINAIASQSLTLAPRSRIHAEQRPTKDSRIVGEYLISTPQAARRSREKKHPPSQTCVCHTYQPHTYNMVHHLLLVVRRAVVISQLNKPRPLSVSFFICHCSFHFIHRRTAVSGYRGNTADLSFSLFLSLMVL